jgi:hypothetical protein
MQRAFQESPVRTTCAYVLKRPIPSLHLLASRERCLNQLRGIKPRPPTTSGPMGFEPGNSKTGTSGSLLSTVLVWNLPPMATCPAATPWCRSHCYNGDQRKDVFRVAEWSENWWWVENAPSALAAVLADQLATARQPCGVRLHSSGDFYSPQYVDFWTCLISSHREVVFWGYTRAWTLPSLRSRLERLRLLPNVQIFASWDRTMSAAPSGWRRSLVFDSLDEAARHVSAANASDICREQVGASASCACCGICTSRSSRDTVFLLH